MKIKVLFFIFLFFIAKNTIAQEDMYRQSIKTHILSPKYEETKSKFYDYLQKKNLKIVSVNDNSDTTTIIFYMDKDNYSEYIPFLNELGYIVSNDISTESWKNQYETTKKEISFLKEKKISYEELLKKISSQEDKYIEFWKELKDLEKSIFTLEERMEEMQKRDVKYVVSIVLEREETASEMSLGSVRFVNMPGGEYSILNVENPKNDFSGNKYEGYFLKYLFTKGKSFFSLGAYKNMNPKGEEYSELFLVGFGQDFYSRYLGRGNRKFLNLYSGYTIGGAFLSREKDKTNFFYLQPSVGIELFKSKFILLDTKINYFLPINKDMNTNFRGISYNFSLNFVF